MSTHNICFRREVRKIVCGYPLLSVTMCMHAYTYLGLCSSHMAYQGPFSQTEALFLFFFL